MNSGRLVVSVAARKHSAGLWWIGLISRPKGHVSSVNLGQWHRRSETFSGVARKFRNAARWTPWSHTVRAGLTDRWMVGVQEAIPKSYHRARNTRHAFLKLFAIAYCQRLACFGSQSFRPNTYAHMCVGTYTTAQKYLDTCEIRNNM